MGHLFVAQGDLTKLACDALVIPCNEKSNVNIAWAPILPVDTPRVGPWLRIAGTANACGVIKLPAASRYFRWLVRIVSTHPLCGCEGRGPRVSILWKRFTSTGDNLVLLSVAMKKYPLVAR